MMPFKRPDTPTLEGIEDYVNEIEELSAACPICGVELDEYTDCGCFAELHYGD